MKQTLTVVLLLAAIAGRGQLFPSQDSIRLYKMAHRPVAVLRQSDGFGTRTNSHTHLVFVNWGKDTIYLATPITDSVFDDAHSRPIFPKASFIIDCGDFCIPPAKLKFICGTHFFVFQIGERSCQAVWGEIELGHDKYNGFSVRENWTYNPRQ